MHQVSRRLESLKAPPRPCKVPGILSAKTDGESLEGFNSFFFYMRTMNYDESRIMQQIARADAIISGCWGECAQESGERWGCLAWGREEDSMPFQGTCNKIL